MNINEISKINKNNQIFFSIIICCYNSEEFIEETIKSIIKQTYKNWEIVIIDDGSFDSTRKIIQKYIEKKIPINYYYQNNKGYASARNKGLELSKYDWLVIIDHDDICIEERLEIQNKNIIENPTCNLFFGDALYFNKIESFSKFENLKNKDKFLPHKLNLKKTNAFKNLIIHGCFIVSSTVTFNKTIINEIGNFNTKFKIVSDYDFFLRLSNEFNIYCSNKIISKWRIHEKQTTSTKILLYYKELSQIFLNLIYNKDINYKLKMIIFYKLLINYCKIIILILKNAGK